MGRIAQDSRINSRESRARLKQQHEPYWRAIHEGLALGYRKGKTGGTWIIRQLVDNKYVKLKLGLADDNRDPDGESVLDFKQAQRKAIDIADQGLLQSESQRRRKLPSLTVEAAIRDYLKHYRIENAPKPATLRAAEQSCESKIINKLGDRLVNELTTQMIVDWRSELLTQAKLIEDETTEQIRERERRRKSTVNRLLTFLKAALNRAYSIREDIESDTAWRKVKPFKNVDVAKVRYLSPIEAKKLIMACTPDFRKLVSAALLTGCRYGELIEMQVRDFNPGTGTILARETKNGKPRTIPLNDEGQIHFNNMIEGKAMSDLIFKRNDNQPWGKSHQARRMESACKAANITPPATFHNLRDTYASQLAMSGVPMKVIAELLGHSDTRVTEKHYAKLQEDHVAATLRQNLPSFM